MGVSSYDSTFHNVQRISQHANRRAEAFRVVKGKTLRDPALIKKNSFVTELFLRIKHALIGGGKKHRSKLQALVNRNIHELNEANRDAFVNQKDGSYTELFLAAQRYNHVWQMHGTPELKKDSRLFGELSLQTPVLPESCPETAPVMVKMDNIRRSQLKNIPAEQQPLVQEKKGYFHSHRTYHYNEADKKISHGSEAAHIFSSTQRERLLSCIGRIVEKAGKIFNKEITSFKKYHYFTKGEDKNGEIYAHDAPLSSEAGPSSYWIGHATCMLSVPVKTDDHNTVKINIITDPVEGDLNKLLYPRMTRPARKVDDSPIPHVFMLSHNHLDHYDKATIKKLRKYQPLMLVPEGDAKKFRSLGFKNVHEHNWWQTTTIPIEQLQHKGELKITAVPAHHWSGQGPCDGHHAAFLGYVVQQEEGDIYFAGDTARLTEEHIGTLRERFNIRNMFQPGGPDEVRKDMESTHQASVDGLWMHFNLMMRNLYDRGDYAHKSKDEFIEAAKQLRTVFMHTKTYKLGNLHYDDTDASINRVKQGLREGQLPEETKDYEKQVFIELLLIGHNLVFKEEERLEASDILHLLDEGVIIPKIGARTSLASYP